MIKFPKLLGHARGNKISEILVPGACPQKEALKTDSGPLEKHARGLQEDEHQELSAEILVPRETLST